MEDMINQVIQADCLEVMKELPDNCIDLVLTDPPYGIGRVWQGGKGSGWLNARREATKRNEWDSSPPDKRVFDEIFRISRNQIIWGGNYFGLPTSRCWLVWNKPERNFTLAEAELAWTSFDKVIRVYDCHRSDQNRQHPTQKPVALMEWCIENYSKPTDLILDCFAGSGTTGVAAKKCGRKFILIEKEPEYVEICKKRLQQEVLF